MSTFTCNHETESCSECDRELRGLIDSLLAQVSQLSGELSSAHSNSWTPSEILKLKEEAHVAGWVACREVAAKVVDCVAYARTKTWDVDLFEAATSIRALLPVKT